MAHTSQPRCWKGTTKWAAHYVCTACGKIGAVAPLKHSSGRTLWCSICYYQQNEREQQSKYISWGCCRHVDCVAMHCEAMQSNASPTRPQLELPQTPAAVHPRPLPPAPPLHGMAAAVGSQAPLGAAEERGVAYGVEEPGRSRQGHHTDQPGCWKGTKKKGAFRMHSLRRFRSCRSPEKYWR